MSPQILILAFLDSSWTVASVLPRVSVHTSGRKTHTQRTFSRRLCSKSPIVLRHSLVSWPYLCSCQMDKTTVHSCILSPSATHNWIVRLAAWDWAQRSYLVYCVLSSSVSLTLLSLVLPLLFLNQSTLSSLIALTPPSNPSLPLSCSDPLSVYRPVSLGSGRYRQRQGFRGHFTSVAAN